MELTITATSAPASRRRPSRIAILVVFGALLVGACDNAPSPSPNPSVSTSAAPSGSMTPSSGAPSPSPTAAACSGTDIRATGGPWGGAAGSRGSDIVVENQGTAPCLLPAGPTIALVDASGTVLLSTPARAGSGPSVGPGGTVGFSLVFGNWCAQGAQLPIHVRLALASDAVDITNLVVSSSGDLPPCNGPGQPASLSTTEWQPS
jgi:hypothetical protein